MGLMKDLRKEKMGLLASVIGLHRGGDGERGKCHRYGLDR